MIPYRKILSPKILYSYRQTNNTRIFPACAQCKENTKPGYPDHVGVGEYVTKDGLQYKPGMQSAAVLTSKVPASASLHPPASVLEISI